MVRGTRLRTLSDGRWLNTEQSDSDLEAQERAFSLRELVERQVDESPNIASRLSQLELPPGATELDEPVLTGVNGPSDVEDDPIDASILRRGLDSNSILGGATNHIEKALTVQAPKNDDFEIILYSTRVYDRVKHREIDATSTVSTTRSRTWTALSGLSLAQISTVAVIKLPLYDPELRRFLRLASRSAMSSATTLQYLDDTSEPRSPAMYTLRKMAMLSESPPSIEYSYHPRAWALANGVIRRGGFRKGAMAKTMMKLMTHLEKDPTPLCSAGPIGYDLVCGSLVKYPSLVGNS